MVIVGLEDLVLTGGDFRPQGKLSGVLIAENDEIRAVDVIWWYAWQQKNGRLRPNQRFTTFNAHRLRLPTWREPIAVRRGLVFADAIGESNPVPGYKTKKQQSLWICR